MGIYKSIKLNLVEADVFDSANVLMKEVADEIETAFTGFDGEFEFGKPSGTTKNTIDGKPYIAHIDYIVNFDGLLFAFEVSLNNSAFSRTSYDPNILWRHYGAVGGSATRPFSVDAANKLAEATKIAWDLKSKIQSQFDEFINANPFPEEGE